MAAVYGGHGNSSGAGRAGAQAATKGLGDDSETNDDDDEDDRDVRLSPETRARQGRDSSRSVCYRNSDEEEMSRRRSRGGTLFNVATTTEGKGRDEEGARRGDGRRGKTLLIPRR
jgi:hypothetical protein